MAAKAGTVFQFKLSAPSSVWTIDCKANNVGQGETATPECTLELSDADFMLMCTGKADPQQLFTGGKLKIGGNVMASMKLGFLKKLEPELVMAAMRSRIGGAAAAEVVPPAAETGPTSADVFVAIRDYIEKNPELAPKLQTVFGFQLKSPDSAYTIDLKTGKGAVLEGIVGTPDCTLELSNADFMDMTSGKADPQQLFTGGKLKISGNVMASMKLGFLKKLDMKAAQAAIAANRAKGSTTTSAAAPAAAPTKAAQAPAIADKLAAKLAALKQDQAVTLQLRITDPASAWVLNLGPQGGSISVGEAGQPAATLTLADADLLALAQGKATAQSLFQRGQLRVDGDARLAHHLSLLEGAI